MTSLAEQPPPDADAANGVATDTKSKDDDMKEADETARRKEEEKKRE